MPPSISVELSVVCRLDANPGGLMVHATAPAVGEYDPEGHVSHVSEEAFRNVPAPQGTHAVRAVLE
jgi:hypothetical protein